MKVIYVSGPFSADNNWEIEQNIRRAESLSLEVWKEGCAAICPHANSRFFNGTLTYEEWLQGDLEILSRCDGVIVVSGPRSKGVLEEIALARSLFMKVFDDISQLREWLKHEQY